MFKKQKNSKKNSGFTLIELLVVVSILGLLASITIVTMNVSRARARDVRRIQDAQALRTAIELFYDANGKYPAISFPCCTTTNIGTPAWNELLTQISPYTNSRFRPQGPYYMGYYNNIGPCIITSLNPRDNIKVGKNTYVLIVRLEEPNSSLSNWTTYSVNPPPKGYMIQGGTIQKC